MPFETIRSNCVVLPKPDIDTDQIIPAHWLQRATRQGLAKGLFEALRRDHECPLERPELRQARILVAGSNFGCGSSREHAAWALRDWGFAAVIATSFGDIFRVNALKNALLPVQVAPEFWEHLARLAANAQAQVSVDLEAGMVTAPDGRPCRFEVDAFSRHCLLEGVDELGWLLAHRDEIVAFERSRT